MLLDANVGRMDYYTYVNIVVTEYKFIVYKAPDVLGIN